MRTTTAPAGDFAPERRLNIGCGSDVRVGWTNLDRVQLVGVDVVADIDTEPLPFDDGSFDFVLAKDVLEHCSHPLQVIEEIHRVLTPGGVLHLQVPHFTSRGAYLDPTHVRSYSVGSFEFVTRGHERSYYLDRQFAAIGSARITFDRGRLLFWNRPMEWLVNISPRAQRIYEQTPWRIFPAMNVVVELIK